MWGSFRSEWVKLRRRAMVLGVLGATVGVTVGVTALTVLTAGGASEGGGAGPGGPGDGSLGVAALSQSDGLALALGRSSQLLGVVALAVFAASMATEFSGGTLRNLLVREPHRLRLLGGKYLALISFMAISVGVAALAGGELAVVIGPSNGISTSTWLSATGLGAFALSAFNVVLATAGFGTLGMVLALVLRSPVAAVGVGVAYLLPVETILNATLSGIGRWLPGQVLGALAAGGNADASYMTALVTGLAYVVVLGGGAAWSFRQRDVPT